MSPVKIVQHPGNFLLFLNGTKRVAEWNGNIPNKWGITFKEGASWEMRPVRITDEDRIEILARFGLLAWQDDLPLEVVEEMSPAQLIKMRRQKEVELNLKRLEVYRDGITRPQDFPAEIFG